MKRLKQSDNPSKNCLLTCLAMVLGKDPNQLIDQLDGIGDDRVVGPDRVYHLQEILDIVLPEKKLFIVIEALPTIGKEARLVFDEEHAIQRFGKYLQASKGILVSASHAYAWDGRAIIDPRTGCELCNFPPGVIEYWILLG